MADPNWSEIIRNNPIGTSLDSFRALFNSICNDKGFVDADALDQLDQNDLRNLAFTLLAALHALPAASLLRSRSGKSFLIELPSLYPAITSGDFNPKHLLNAVLAAKSDDEIWKDMYDAVTEYNPLHFKQTPSSSCNIVSSFNSSECRNNTDDVLRADLGPMYVDLPSLYETFCGGIPELEGASQAIFQSCSEGPDPFFSEGWTGWPREAKESTVFGWLQMIIGQIIQWARDYRPTPPRGLLAKSNKPLRGLTANRKLDVGIVSCSEAFADWSQILIPGSLKSNPNEDRQNGAWFDIGQYVRGVFAAQDTRHFVLAFTLCGSFMRVWEFDRLGGIASMQFDINENGLQFVSTILSFLWIDEKGLGFDPTFIPFNGKRCIEITRDGMPERIVIDRVIGRVPCIAGRATTCWKAHPEGDPSTRLVIKDSWQDPERDVEGELLCDVTEKGVCNVARYYYHETIYVDGNVDDVQHGIRKGLDLAKASNYHLHDFDTRSISQISQGSATSQKRSRSKSPTKVDPAYHSAARNRVHRRVIVRDYGKNIYKASTPIALLAALENCIQGHESLLRKANILHRDISVNNLMINEDSSNPSWPGFLVDLDLAIYEQRERASGAKGKTGTRAFMAIGVLRGKQHSFMHDLESFFWVLFWICIHYDGPGNGRVVRRFDKWNYLNANELASDKMGTVSAEDFFIETITQYFTPYYAPLIPWVNRLRRVVFDNDGSRADLGLYSRMREVLREAQKDEKILSNTAST
ncbi:hypothetical protein F4810DRAFT_663412 [Camillea tinctor]|nr:hypothetical protein F4810DRAFT_663412 [Camillea tinctor]